MKKNHQNQNLTSFDLFSLFNQLTNSQDYISYKKLIASVLLKANLGFSSEQYHQFEKMTEQALKNKYDLLLNDFVISFNVDLKYGFNILVPVLISQESTNNEAISFVSHTDLKLNNFLKIFNLFITKLVDQNKIVEIFPSILIYRSKNTQSLKIAFDDKYLAVRGS
ncbi:DUF2714 domain-containing protein [Mycoplasma putrefaciens]|uniref:DUF2714 domain-containing protein n=1 Tax=Mycoplasma putrefaciens Mput9231 TaxID=1292033 RepID=M9WH86_9MOLU|nr:DUF2714 domain-containing protein [Mycoplasma putrefaciens]AGJ90820.1 Hypothetical protein MPUT9231_4100 [Mycoplasma putrefaciens Mput9231]